MLREGRCPPGLLTDGTIMPPITPKICTTSSIVFCLTLLFFNVASRVCEAADGVVNAGRPFRENVTLPVDSNLLKQFGTVEDVLADQRWTDAIRILQEIAQTESKDLVLVQPGKVGDVANYLNVATRCNVLLSRVPAEGRIAYRKKVDPQAKRWFDNWERTRDPAELLRIVRQAFLSSYGDDALWALGEVAWDQGEFSTAQSWWEQLIPLPEDADQKNYPTVLRFPDSEIDRATILARIVMCSILANEPYRAAEQLRQFADRFPQAEAWLAGRQGRLAEILQQTLDASKSWASTQTSAEVKTFALSPERNGRVSESNDVGALRWNHPLPPNVLPRRFETLPLPVEPLSYHPVVHNEVVLVNDANAIRAWNVLTGEPAWQSEGRDPAVIYPSIPDETTAVVSERPCVGVPHYTMTIAGDRLYARMGSPVTCSSTSETRRDSDSDLVCLDLNKEGKLIWKINANELLPDPVPWRFEGTPIIVAGRAFVALCRRNPQLELMVVCLDAFDGRLRWQRHVGAFRASVGENNNRVSHLLLTAGSGRIFLSTDAGAIIALDALDGGLAWAVSYERNSDESVATLSDPTLKNLLPALFHAGLLFIAPNDSNAAYCLEADSGRLRWRFPYLQNTTQGLPPSVGRSSERSQLLGRQQWRHLLGVGPGGLEGRLIVSGNSLWAIDIEKGVTAWPQHETPLGGGGNLPFGRGLISGNQILIPLRESIEIFDLTTGEPKRSVLLKTPTSPQQGGNLTVTGGMLMVAQPNRLAAYCEYGRLKERIEREIIQRPDDTALGIQLAELEAVDGTTDTAIAGFEGVLARIKFDDPAYFRIRRKLMTLLRDAGTARLREAKLVEARDYLTKAFRVADDITKKVDLIFELSRLEEILHRPAAAQMQLQQVLNSPGLASVRRENVTAGSAALRQISKLIEKNGRETYREIEQVARTEFEGLRQTADRAALQRFVAKYPHAEITAAARQRLVQLFRGSGQTSEAYAMLDEIRGFPADKQAFVETTLSMIELLQRVRDSNSEMRLWQALAMQNPSVEVVFAGTKNDVVELARKQLERINSEPRPQPSFVQKFWNYPLPIGSQVIIPEGDPPSSGLAVILVCSKHATEVNTWIWRCLDQRTGKVRWEEFASSPVIVAGWNAVHLLIGTRHGWFARMPDNGRHVWEQISLAETNPLFVKPSRDDFVWPAFFDVTRGLQLFHSGTGENIAILKPQGQLHPIIGVRYSSTVQRIENAVGDSEYWDTQGSVQSIRLFMQTVKPTRVWCASAPRSFDHWTIQEVTKDGETWLGNPFVLGKRLIGITSDRFLVGHQFEDLPADPDQADDLNRRATWRQSHHWTYNNLASGAADPVAFESQGELLGVVDGSQLASFDPEAGTRKWTTGLADLPLSDALHQVCVGNGLVFATSQGVLRSISIHDGRVRVSQYLGDTTPQWCTRIAWATRPFLKASREPQQRPSIAGTKMLVAAWPLNSVETNRSLICLCDAETGTCVQQIRTNGVPQDLRLDHEGFGVFWTNKSLFGLRFFSPTEITETSRPLGSITP